MTGTGTEARLAALRMISSVLDDGASLGDTDGGGAADPRDRAYSRHLAYGALVHQGFTRDTIHYLSDDIHLDLDANGLTDDVDGEATNLNLHAAVTSWAPERAADSGSSPDSLSR